MVPKHACLELILAKFPLKRGGGAPLKMVVAPLIIGVVPPDIKGPHPSYRGVTTPIIKGCTLDIRGRALVSRVVLL